jgi:hypothetical protein
MAPYAKAVISVMEEGDILHLRFTDSSTMAINRAKLRETPLPTSLKRLMDSDMDWAGLPEVDISSALRELVEVGERLLRQQAQQEETQRNLERDAAQDWVVSNPDIVTPESLKQAQEAIAARSDPPFRFELFKYHRMGNLGDAEDAIAASMASLRALHGAPLDSESIRGVSSNLPPVEDELRVASEHMEAVMEAMHTDGFAAEPLVSTPKDSLGFTPTTGAGQLGQQSLSAFRQHRLNEWVPPDRAFKHLDDCGQAAVRMLENLENMLMAFFDEHGRVPNVLIARREWYRCAGFNRVTGSAASSEHFPVMIVAPLTQLLPPEIRLHLIVDRDIATPSMRYLEDPYAYVPIYEKRRRVQEASQTGFRVEAALDTVAPVGPCVVRPRERRIVLDQPGETE